MKETPQQYTERILGYVQGKKNSQGARVHAKTVKLSAERSAEKQNSQNGR